MMKVPLTNEILKYIMKNASTKIEGNPLSEKQADEVIESDRRKYRLKPEQQVGITLQKKMEKR